MCNCLGFDQSVLNHVRVVLFKSRFAISEVKLPNANEAFVKAELQHLRFVGHELVAPAAQGLGVVQPKSQFVDDFQTGAFSLCAKFARARQAAARKMYC